MTVHTEEEMDEDDLIIFDVERCVLTGQTVAKQKDSETKEWKSWEDLYLGGLRERCCTWSSFPQRYAPYRIGYCSGS